MTSVTPTATTVNGDPVLVTIERNAYGTVFWSVHPKHDYVLLDDGDGPELHLVDEFGEMKPVI